jgi:hypothetical protein
MASYLKDRTQFVSIEEKVSNIKTLPKKGVPQGSILGPLLFLIYINDLPTAVGCGNNTFMYADDTAFVFGNNDKRALSHCITQSMGLALDWFTANRLKLNLKKTELLNFGKKNNVEVIVNGECLKTSSTVKYLGVTLDRKLSWQSHLETVLNKAGANLFAIKTVINGLTLPARISLLNALVISHLRYCNVVWQPNPFASKIG